MRPRFARTRSALTAVALLGAAACTSAGPSGAGSLAPGRPLVVALPPGGPAAAAQGTGLLRFLESALGRPVQLRPEPAYAALAADLRAARADVAFTSDAGYLAVLRSTPVHVIAQAAVPPSSNPAIVCAAAAGVKPLRDGGDWSSLRGKSVLFSPEGSLGGNIWPRYFMRRSGLDPIGDLADVRVVANEREALLDVYNGIADCATPPADDRGQVSDVAPDITSRVALVFSAPAPVPAPPVVARPGLDGSVASRFVRALAAAATDADASAQLAAITGSPAGRPARDSDYNLLKNAVENVDPSLVTRGA